MADVQQQFEKFHEAIRVDFEMSATLREKRDIVVEKINNHLKEKSRPLATILLQGSYKMKTGVKPIGEMEYDIDIGLRFPITEDDYDAATVRQWVMEAVASHTKRVESRSACIRVSYEAGFHLDIVCYAVWSDVNQTTQYRLARKDNSWSPADPPALLEYFESARASFRLTDDTATQTDQFRRCVRSIRRWADVLRPKDSNQCKPSGIAIVLLAVQYKLIRSTFLDGRPNDRHALEQLSENLHSTIGRLVARKPTPEYEDVLGELSAKDMDGLKSEFRDLHAALLFAGKNADPVEACKRLREVFGDDFPVPDPKDTAKKAAAPAIITSSSSA